MDIRVHNVLKSNLHFMHALCGIIDYAIPVFLNLPPRRVVAITFATIAFEFTFRIYSARYSGPRFISYHSMKVTTSMVDADWIKFMLSWLNVEQLQIFLVALLCNTNIVTKTRDIANELGFILIFITILEGLIDTDTDKTKLK